MPGTFLWGWDGANKAWVTALYDAAGHAQVDVLTVPTTDVHIYGYDGANWQTLLVESNTLKNLRVRLYGGTNAVEVLRAGTAPLATEYALVTAAVGWFFNYSMAQFDALPGYTEADALAVSSSPIAQARLFGYNGTTWDRLRMESGALHNLRVKLYDGATGISSDLLTEGTFDTDTKTGLYTKAHVLLQLAGGLSIPWRGASYLADNTSGGQLGSVANWGWDGANWDRLRTYGVGILKVGRAHVGLLTVRATATGQVGAAGSRKLYWVHENGGAGNALFELTDAIIGGAAVKFDHFSTSREGHMIPFDPPMEFSNGIYLETFTNMTSLIFGYL